MKTGKKESTNVVTYAKQCCPSHVFLLHRLGGGVHLGISAIPIVSIQRTPYLGCCCNVALVSRCKGVARMGGYV